MVKIRYIHGKDYIVCNIDSFIEHIEKFHTVNGIPDNSIHDENGYYFKIDHKFYKILLNLK
tara:strand:- start:149 stop:331 length:183 start_codon:yes stop_codon:yes gene_type:complete